MDFWTTKKGSLFKTKRESQHFILGLVIVLATVVVIQLSFTPLPLVTEEPEIPPISVEMEIASFSKTKFDNELTIQFVNPDTNNIQEEVDYTIIAFNGGLITDTTLTHSSSGEVVIPYYVVPDASFDVIVTVEGILFKPIPVQTFSYDNNSDCHFESDYTRFICTLTDITKS